MFQVLSVGFGVVVGAWGFRFAGLDSRFVGGELTVFVLDFAWVWVSGFLWETA